jgi:hypothetical protein
MPSSYEECEEIVRGLIYFTRKKIRQRDYKPFGACILVDGTMASVGTDEREYTAKALIEMFKQIADKAMCFGLAAMQPLGGTGGEALHVLTFEHRNGECGESWSIVREVEGEDDVDFEDAVHVRGTPRFFIGRHN